MITPTPIDSDRERDLRPEGRRVIEAGAELHEAVEAARAGMSESEAARVFGLGRLTVRVALGKRRPR